MSFDPCPEALKPIAHYIKIAEEHDKRDVIISYWCRLHALDIALKKLNVTKTPEINKYLISIMDWLEKIKSENINTEGINNKVCGQATVENYALKLFTYADDQDRQENYGKNVVKAFYTAGILMDVLTCFGELSEDIAEKRKYAKWKAAYIHNCLKAGERPLPGPISHEELEEFAPVNTKKSDNDSNSTNPDGLPHWNMTPTPIFTAGTPPDPPSYAGPSPSKYVPRTTSPVLPQIDGFFPAPGPSVVQPPVNNTISSDSSVNLEPSQIKKAQKYCNWAASALNYDDVKTAIDNIQKALHLLQYGKELN